MAASFSWHAGVSGGWATAENWADVTNGNDPALVAPGAADTVLIVNPSVAITGPGQAAALTLQGSVTLDGTFDVGAMTATIANLSIGSGAVLGAASFQQQGVLTLSGTGARVSVVGALTAVPTVFGPHSIVAGTIDLAGGAALQVGTLDAVAYRSVLDFRPELQVTIDAASSFEIGTDGGAASGALTVDAGHTLSLSAVLTGNVVNNGSLVLPGGVNMPQIHGTIGGAGQISLDPSPFSGGTGGTFEIYDAVGAGQTITFGGTLSVKLDAPASFAATLSGFGAAQTLDLPSSITSFAYAQGVGSGTLTLFAGPAQAGTITLAGSYDASNFHLDPVTGAALLTLVPCFTTGTSIRTASGDVPVEALRVGDHVVSVFGGTVPVVWLGHRHVRADRHPRPELVWPVRVRAGALGRAEPARDLWLSPEHAVHLDGVLVPVGLLVNGRTIVQERRDSVTYWHVELPQHDVLLAEGAPCESYLDTNNRADFGMGGVAALHPDFGATADEIWRARACAPQCRNGARLAAIRARLEVRADTLAREEAA